MARRHGEALHLKGKLTIGRPINGIDQRISICIVDDASGVEFVDLEIDLAEFAAAITGAGYQDCKVEVRGLEVLGKVREVRTVLIDHPSSRHARDDAARREIAAAVAAHEVDGWVADVEGSLRRQQNGKQWRVMLFRYVAQEQPA